MFRRLLYLYAAMRTNAATYDLNPGMEFEEAFYNLGPFGQAMRKAGRRVLLPLAQLRIKAAIRLLILFERADTQAFRREQHRAATGRKPVPWHPAGIPQ